jgi:photosystem II stability/assembly factor-like uncharacterized protein
MKKIFLLAAAAILALSGFGCITVGAPQNQGADGGVFKSSDKGQVWGQKNLILTAGGAGTLANINVADFIMDPQDGKAVYLASAGSGLFYTWDGMESWRFVDSLGTGYVNSFVVDYKNKCVLYAALQNKVQKSIDCGRSWDTMYFDTRAEIYVSALAVDPANSNILYAGLSRGDMLKSLDAGKSWSTIWRVENKIQKIMIHTKDSRTIFAATENNGLWKSVDAGAKWEDLKTKMGDFRDSNIIYDLDMDKDGKTMYLTSMYGILASDNLGANWRKIDLLTPPGTIQIYALAINPQNASEIYYSTASTFYSSFDGGKNWVTKKLPTGRAGTALMVHPNDANMIYMGTRLFKK